MNDEKLLNQRFEFKKDEPVQETVESPESGTTEEYTFLGWWDFDKFQLPPVESVKDKSYYIVIKPTNVVDNFLASEGDWVMAMDGKWTVVICDAYTPETVWDSNSRTAELKAMGVDTVSLLKDRVRELNTELTITVAKYIKSFAKLNPIMAYILDDDYNYISVPSKGINETVQFRVMPSNWSFRSKFCKAIFWDARFSTNTCELLSYTKFTKYDSNGVMVRDVGAVDIHDDANLFEVISIYERAIDFIKRHGKR